MTIICNSESMMTHNVHMCFFLYCLYLTLFLGSLFACTLVCERTMYTAMPLSILWGWFLLTRAACIQGYLPVVPVSNSKFMEWLCYVLGWSWSLLRACGNDFTLLFYPVILWWLGKSDLTYSYNCTHISCALKRLEQFRCCMPLTHRTWWHFWDLCLHSISFSSNLFDDPSD